MSNNEFIVRNRRRTLQNRVYDEASSYVDEFMRIPDADRRMDLYRSQETIPSLHPNGYQGQGMNLRDSQMQEGYQPSRAYPQNQFIPGASPEGSRNRPGYADPSRTYIDQSPRETGASQEGVRIRSGQEYGNPPRTYGEDYPLEMNTPINSLPETDNNPVYDEGSRRRMQFDK